MTYSKKYLRSVSEPAKNGVIMTTLLNIHNQKYSFLGGDERMDSFKKFFNDEFFIKIFFACIPSTILVAVQNRLLSTIIAVIILLLFSLLFNWAVLNNKEMMENYPELVHNENERCKNNIVSRIAMIFMWVLFVIALIHNFK